MQNQTHDPFSSFTTQEKQFLHVLGKYPKETRWEHVYQAWKEAATEKISVNVGQTITALYSGEELWDHYLDLVEEASSKRPWQANAKRLSLGGSKNEPRQPRIVRDDTLDMMELPATVLQYDGLMPQTMMCEQYLFRTYLFLWPIPVETRLGHLCYGFTIRRQVNDNDP